LTLDYVPRSWRLDERTGRVEAARGWKGYRPLLLIHERDAILPLGIRLLFPRPE
jgi:hypothetical protein